MAAAAGIPCTCTVRTLHEFTRAVQAALGTYSYALYLFHVAVRRFIRDEYFPVASFPEWLDSPLPGQLLFYVVATAPALDPNIVTVHSVEEAGDVHFITMELDATPGDRCSPPCLESWPDWFIAASPRTPLTDISRPSMCGTVSRKRSRMCGLVRSPPR